MFRHLPDGNFPFLLVTLTSILIRWMQQVFLAFTFSTSTVLRFLSYYHNFYQEIQNVFSVLSSTFSPILISSCVCVCLLCRALSLILFLFTFLEFCLFNFASVPSPSSFLYKTQNVSLSVRMFVRLPEPLGLGFVRTRCLAMEEAQKEGTTRQIQTNTTATSTVFKLAYTTLQIPHQTKQFLVDAYIEYYLDRRPDILESNVVVRINHLFVDNNFFLYVTFFKLETLLIIFSS